MKSIRPFAALLLFTWVGCTASPSKPTFGGKTGSKGTLEGKPDGATGSTREDDTQTRAAPLVPGEIQIASDKFREELGNLEALVKLSGTTSTRLKLSAADGKAKVSVPGLPTNVTDTLIVEIYEKDKLRFVAKRANTVVDPVKANAWTFSDCDVTKVPWTGDDNEATCGWSIEVSK